MLIDCDRCPRRGGDCPGCLVSTLLGAPDGLVDLTRGELRAIETFELAGFEVEVLETPPAAAPARVLPFRRHVA
jgi:hypothetical protein